MSSNGLEEQATTPQHGTLAPPRPAIFNTLSDNFSSDAKLTEQEVDHGQGEDKTTNATMSSTTESKREDLIDLGEDKPVQEPVRSAADSTNAENETGSRAEIERQASEHLARRATELSIHGEHDGSSNAGRGGATEDKRHLPETPPPPPPPRKNSDSKKPMPAEEEYDEKHPPSNDDGQEDLPETPQGTAEATGEEIQTIMDQFQDGSIGEQEIMSPITERAQPMLVLPPRSSSLEPHGSYTISPQTTGQSVHVASPSPLSPQGTGNSIASRLTQGSKADDTSSIASAKAGSIFQPPPPSPEPEPALPFDFHRFLEQLRHRTADPVARFLRSFLNEFGKKQWMVHEQVKIIGDFLEFIAKKMAMCEVWRTVSDAEFDNAREGMEKLVMNRLYSQTFSPAIPAPTSTSPRKRANRSQADQASPHGTGRRGQHQEDVERDDVIAQKIKIYSWIREEHLDIETLGPKGEKFLNLAQKELLKINSYRAPRDKVICVLNCCKVIFGFLRNSKADQSADAFVPLLIYTVLRAHPDNIVSNVQYIWRFRNPDKLGGEAGYYMSSLMGVVSFIENLDRTNLTITDEEFEKNVEQAVSEIAEKNRAEEYEQKSHSSTAATGSMQQLAEKSALSRPEVTPRNSMDAERSTPKGNPSQRLSEKQAQANQSSPEDDDVDAVTGLLRTIQKPLSSIGRIFSDDASSQPRQSGTPNPGSTPRGLSPAPQICRSQSGSQRTFAESQQKPTADDAAAKQASAEVAQAHALRVREHKVVVETLQSMFPNLDTEVIEDVVRAQEGNVGRAVDGCLALSG
ncbi:hypothetical protein AC579_3599 [Pseudocercospora musae]|uniref:VPS9 domain-containing protein n=1 Tax=Pseudocercospora musae TaxID=113226 RepID=A0A139ISI2_9PEZI|nr:hypothetical protein AC579_3599 [Pseudocercospora musae]KXT17714.1 hypothetical protein AC579_3599 [Pseudocercospora musae]